MRPVRESIVVALALVAFTGCGQHKTDDAAATTAAVAATPPPAATPAAVAAQPAVADNTPDTAPAPPADQVEAPGPVPAGQAWNKGYWRWENKKYDWVKGHFAYQLVEKEPPALRVEVPGRPPSIHHTWLKGNWRWDGKAWDWNGGHWEYNVAKKVWEEPRWEKQANKFHYVAGHWK